MPIPPLPRLFVATKEALNPAPHKNKNTTYKIKKRKSRHINKVCYFLNHLYGLILFLCGEEFGDS